MGEREQCPDQGSPRLYNQSNAVCRVLGHDDMARVIRAGVIRCKDALGPGVAGFNLYNMFAGIVGAIVVFILFHTIFSST
jgi:hypothetical protein